MRERSVTLTPEQLAMLRARLHKHRLMKFKNELRKQRHAAAASQQPKEADHSEEAKKSTQVADVN